MLVFDPLRPSRLLPRAHNVFPHGGPDVHSPRPKAALSVQPLDRARDGQPVSRVGKSRLVCPLAVTHVLVALHFRAWRRLRLDSYHTAVAFLERKNRHLRFRSSRYWAPTHCRTFTRPDRRCPRSS